MNPEVFSTIGYLSVALWVAVPLLWLLHTLWRPRRWAAHIAVGVALASIIAGEVNSRQYVAKIQVEQETEDPWEQKTPQELALEAFIKELKAEAADIGFIEDGQGEALDLAAITDEQRENLERLQKAVREQQDWRELNRKKKRSQSSGDPDDLDAQIGATEDREGMGSTEEFEEAVVEQVTLSAEDKADANRLDAANLKVTRIALLLALLFVCFDYVRRLNSYRESYFPLPVPSTWADALAPREPVRVLPDKPRRPLRKELRMIVRRGEVFLYCTDDPVSAAEAITTMHRLPAGRWPVEVLNAEADAKFDNGFVFETLWFTRHCFVVDSTDRAQAMLAYFAQLLEERRASRAHTKRTVHIVWDCAKPIPEPLVHRLGALCKATGFTLLIAPRRIKDTPEKTPDSPRQAPQPAEATG